MLNKDDEHWISIIANKNVPEADPDTVKEASILRESIRAEERLQQLITDLKAEGYIESTPTVIYFIKQIINDIKSLNLRTIYLVTVHAVLIISVPITIINTRPSEPSDNVPTAKSIDVSAAVPINKLSIISISYNKIPIFKFPYTEVKHAEDFKQEFTIAGAKIKLLQLHNLIELMEITIPNNESKEFYDIFGEYGAKSDNIKGYNKFIILFEPHNKL